MPLSRLAGTNFPPIRPIVDCSRRHRRRFAAPAGAGGHWNTTASGTERTARRTSATFYTIRGDDGGRLSGRDSAAGVGRAVDALPENRDER